MARGEHFLARLLELPHIEDQSVRRGIFRQTITELGIDASSGPLGLAGVDPRALARSMQTAWSDALLDDLDFIAPAAAAVALYQIAGALPLGAERRQIGRKVLAHLYKGNVDTFASVAARMALGSIKPLTGAGIRARVSLALSLRGSNDAAVDRLALAIVTRRELAANWVAIAATGSLPERRLAARLLERAAREAARRAGSGDAHSLKIFRGVLAPARITTLQAGKWDAVGSSWHTLLADRETLVWRHVATARGLLAVVLPQFVEQTRRLLAPDLSPTEWRRGATSLVARIAVDRECGLTDAMNLLDSPLMRRDPGIATAMVWGLVPVTEVEPEAAEELLDAITTISPISVADSVVELRRTMPNFAPKAADNCAAALQKRLSRPEIDDGLSALARCILSDLDTGSENHVLLTAVRRALEAFNEHGTRDAFLTARDALGIAAARVAELETLDVSYGAANGASATRRQAMVLLRDLDAALLEERVLNNLLLLDRRPGSEATGVAAIDDLDARVARWLLDPKRRSATKEEQKTQITLHQRQLRALLHLIDGGSTHFGDDHERRLRVRARWTLASRVFTEHIRKQPNSRLTRAIIASVARAFDALVRDGAAEAVDVFLYVASHFAEPKHIAIIAEASMHPDLTTLLSFYVQFVTHPLQGNADEQAKARLDAFMHFLQAFPSQTTLRAEAVRTTAWMLVHALRSVLSASSLSALVPQESSTADAGPLAAIEDAIGQLHQLVVGAERRCSDQVTKQLITPTKRHALAHAVENAVHTEQHYELVEALTNTARAVTATLPSAIAPMVTQILPRLAKLQFDRPNVPSTPVRSQQIVLPTWLPSRRILGGFYIMQPLGGGNVGTVFVVKRAEDRHDANAERFALKVPEYNATAARTMSEKEFLKLFREEAGALLAIPEHPNVAGFVTFDAGAKPKPILVMELIDGVSCERAIAAQSMTMDSAIATLDGVMAGLEAMHSTGIAHLDVKPSNVILRESRSQAVLVDFGLSGRKIRPGCATLCYGSPEIWQGVDEDAPGLAFGADIYAFGCFAFEVMTTMTLFEGVSDVAIISAHITHDGMPPGVKRLAETPGQQELAMFLHQCLRSDPTQRSGVTTLRSAFDRITPMLSKLDWPIRMA